MLELKFSNTYISEGKLARTKKSDEQIRTHRTKAINKVSYGSEPDWGDNRFLYDENDIEVKLGQAFTWYNYQSNASDKRKWLIAFLSEDGSSSDILDKVARFPDSWLNLYPAGQIARCLSRNAPLNPIYKEKIHEKVNFWIKELEREKNNPSLIRSTCKPRVDHRIKEVIGILETHLDDYLGTFDEDNLDLDFTGIFDSLKATREHVQSVCDRFSPRAQEMRLALAGKDKDLTEAYSHLEDFRIRRILDFYDGLFESLVKVRATRKATGPRRKKTTEELVKKVAYQLSCKLGKEVYESFSPKSIIGAREIWILNTKYNNLTRFVAEDTEGLQITGTSIRNYDRDESMGKKIKKPEQWVNYLRAAKVPDLRHVMEKLRSTEQVPSTRLNDVTFLIRVVR